MSLFTLATGTAGPRVAFLHGLFGQGRNWMQIAKGVAGPQGGDARCLLLDLPNHGRSPWTDSFSYAAYADAVAQTLAAAAPGERWTLVGHSMGGKTAMECALAHPELLERLVVVDIAPRAYGHLHAFADYAAAMKALPLATLTTRADVETAFEGADPDPGVRAFLLQNLRRDGTSWQWQANLDLVEADARRPGGALMGAWADRRGERAAYDGPVLWIAGAESDYVREEDGPAMRALFPKARLLTVKGAGHWVHSDAPAIVTEALRQFVRVPASEPR